MSVIAPARPVASYLTAALLRTSVLTTFLPVPCEVAARPAIVGAEADEPTAPAEAMTIDGPDVVAPYKLVRLSVKNPPAGHFILWDVYPPDNIDAATQRLKSRYEFTGPPGAYKVRVRAFRMDSDVPLEAWRSVTIGTAPGPQPPGPQPPGPQPPPPPIAGDGNRVLIVYETGQAHPPAQAAVLTSAVVREYLDSKCARDEANPTGAYRIWDKDVRLDHPSVSASWKAAMARPRQSLPWLVVSNGKTGYEGPLPADVPQTMTILKRYLGD